MLTRRAALQVCLLATAWMPSVIPRKPQIGPRTTIVLHSLATLSVGIGEQFGIDKLEVLVGTERFEFTPEDIAAALRKDA